MAQKNYLVSEAIQVTYQPAKAESGLLDVTMEIYDETGAKDIINFPDVTMTEIGVSGRYTGSFTPDAEGEWVVMVSHSSSKDQVVKQYSVGAYNLNTVGDAATSTASPPMIG